MLKLIATVLTSLLLLPSLSWALQDSYSLNLVEKSMTSIENSSDKRQQMALAAEFKSLVLSRADQIGAMSETNKSYDAESSDLVDLVVALDRATIKKSTPAECKKALNGLLEDAGVENVEEVESQSWNQLKFTLQSKLSTHEYTAFRILKAICE
ncbi:hypothetical protein DOM22_03745 [Bdellovibrio sp. ZAP7]|uniref:hypothetical protein n=1 Tax=Bdellovibrio sp. ZAP7 TaxID=2231053 RepID=UPI00115927FA|nr:hypothetical protein [Bdellovibrio sp. ZAP7]QDK44331.1 hypothetical protein DOM22_03745 [Bdellovibrio sp. ZAP7]